MEARTWSFTPPAQLLSIISQSSKMANDLLTPKTDQNGNYAGPLVPQV